MLFSFSSWLLFNRVAEALADLILRIMGGCAIVRPHVLHARLQGSKHGISFSLYSEDFHETYPEKPFRMERISLDLADSAKEERRD